MKSHDLARELLKGPNLEIEICTGSWECDPTTDAVEAYEYDKKNWKWDNDLQKYIPLPDTKILRFTEKTPEKPLKGELVNDKCIEL